MATPHVAGVASVLYSLKPSIKVTDVESILRKSAKDLGKKVATRRTDTVA